MEIKELGGEYWNMFFIPITPKENETDKEYLTRARDCLESFYEKYTSTSKESQKWGPFRKDIPARLESLTEEWNFCEFNLKDISYCDVKFHVQVPSQRHPRIGINVHSHRDRPEWRKPMLDLLRENWKEFDYTFK